MGGNAFGEGAADRIPQKVYDEACRMVEGKLRKILEFDNSFGLDIGVPLSIGNKRDYGDIDVLIGAACPHDFFEQLQLYFGDNILKYSRSGYRDDNQYPVPSMLLNFKHYKIQVDFIFVPEDQFESAFHYFSYNDLGCLLGVMARKKDMKLGFDGLHYRMSAVEHGCNLEPILTNDWHKMLDYFGLSRAKYDQGFDSLEDMFQYIITCRFFNPAFFQFENLNHINRLRNRKRKTYQSFVDWVNMRHFPGAFIAHEDRHEQTFADINKDFPDSLLVVQRWSWKEQQEKERLIKSKFNGTIVMSLTNLKGKALGDFISRLKESPDFERIGLFGSKKEAEDLIISLYVKESETIS